MAVWFLTGLPGHGKSLYAMSRYVLPALRRGRAVFHNIEGFDSHRAAMIPMYFPEIDPQDIDSLVTVIPDANVLRFWEFVASGSHPNNALIVIDECQNYWGARDFASSGNRSMVEYLTTHRHFGHDVLMVTQHQDNVDVAVRRMVDLSYMVVNNKSFGSGRSSRVYTYNRDNIGKNLDLTSSVYRYDKRFFALYDSYQNKGVKERKVAPSILLNPKLFFFYLFFAFLAFLFVSNWLGGGSVLFSRKRGVSGPSPAAAEVLSLPASPPSFEYPMCGVAFRNTKSGFETYLRGEGWRKGVFPECM